MLYDVFVQNFQLLLIIITRTVGLMTTAPVFAGTGIPARFKYAFALFIAVASFPVVKSAGKSIPQSAVDYFILLVENFSIGALIGLFVFVVFAGFQFAAKVFSIPMGLGMSEVVDPLSQISAPAVANILIILSMLVYLHLDGPYYLIRGIVESFKLVWTLSFPKSLEVAARSLTSSFGAMMMIGVKIALPVIGTLIAVDIALGILSRLAPQMNVMFIGFNIKVILGILFIWWGIPAIITLSQNIVQTTIENAWHIIEFLH